MELGKQGSSGTSSSEENDTQDHHHHSRRQEVVQKEEKIINSSPSGATTKRFYECSYCKKGFDNAQALGGHMNIHRGAKAKAKQARTATPNSSITTIKSNEEYLNPSYGNVGPRSGFYHMYFQPSGSLPGQNYGYNYQYGAEFLVPRPTSSLNVNGELWGSNLSLRIGSGRGQESEVDARGVAKEDEVDLELRLGHHDRY